MAKQTTKYYQECDFCHKEFEISSGGLDSITLPGRYVDTDGSQPKQWIKADICPECKERLREYLAKAVDIKEDAYYGTNIHWLDDKEKIMAIKIIKLGKKPDTVKRFTCKHCGCVFMADVDDCEVAYSLLNGYYLKIECPCCGYIIRKSCNE